MEEIVKTQHVESTHGKVRVPETKKQTADEALRSTGDARKVVGADTERQKEQPSLGDPENAPGRPLRRSS